VRELIKRISVIHIVTIAASTAVVLSLAHHQLNFWGLAWYQQALCVLVGFPIVIVPIYHFLKLTWARGATLSTKRWLIFLLPAVIASGILAWRITLSPFIWHQLEIFPDFQPDISEVRIIEIKLPQGSRIPFADIDRLGGWRIADDTLVADGSNPEPLTYSFRGPIDKPVRITFISLPESPAVSISLDGLISAVVPEGDPGSLKVVNLPVRYRFGVPSGIAMSVIIGIDLLAFLFLFTVLFLAQEIAQSYQPPHRNKQHIPSLHLTSILILIGLGFSLHSLNLLAVPLVVVGDSTSFLDGALHWVKNLNLDGVSSSRGPGVSMLIIPVMAIFGRNPWGLKIYLHLLAMACIPLCYLLGWQLSGKRWFAFLSGSIAVLTPDLYLYSNLVMSEIPNIFFGLAYLVVLVLALETFQWTWLISSMVIGAFTALVRPENIVMFAVGILFLIVKGFLVIRNQQYKSKPINLLSMLGLSIFIGILPLFWWSAHNQRVYGFFGLSDYAGEVLYDGWIYFGESSHIPITDQDSSAARIISSNYVHHPRSADDTDAPTGWDVFPALVNAGYSQQQAFAILRQTAIDSILRNPTLALELLFIKIREGFVPETTATFTIDLPGESSPPDPWKSAYFDEEILIIPFLKSLQQADYVLMDYWYIHGYQLWIWICLTALGLCLYRRPFFLWAPLVVLTAIRILFPTIMGLSHWRYVLSGILPLQLFALAGFHSLAIFMKTINYADGKKSGPPSS
jgi:4-amino-4-deoxy-L-arabinose transferase-like glycosyltransferase